MTPRNPMKSFFAELSRRRVLKIGGAYIAGAWLGAEILNFLFQQFNAPDWSYRLLAIIYVVGFPVSMVLAWVVQVSDDGRWEIDRSRGDYRVLAIAIVAGLLVTLGLSWRLLPQREAPPAYEPLPASLAVLPLVNPSATPHAQSSAETLYRALMAGLEQSVGLTLVRLGPVQQTGDLTEFGRSLGVAGLASGFFQQAEGGTWIEMRMLNAATGEVSWSQSFEWDVTQIPKIANNIANGLLQAMALPPLEGLQFQGTDSREAYQAFLEGEEHAASLEAARLTEAVEFFQTAINLDSGYAKAHIALAQALYDLADVGALPGPEREALELRAGNAVEMAQKLDPDSADAISLLGLGLDNRHLRIQAWERALELDPDHAMSYYRYAVQMRVDGNSADAERLLRRAIALRPMNARFRLELAKVLELQGRDKDAEAERKKAEDFRAFP